MAWKASGAGMGYAEAVKSNVLARPRVRLAFGWGGRQALPFRVFLNDGHRHERQQQLEVEASQWNQKNSPMATRGKNFGGNRGTFACMGFLREMMESLRARTRSG